MSDKTLYIRDIKENDYLESFDLHIKPCYTIQEKLEYAKIFISAFEKKKRDFLIAFLNCFNGDEELYILMNNKEDNVGCFTLKSKGKNRIYLYDFCILDKYRGLGYSKEALRIIYNIALDEYKKELLLYVKKGNKIALQLYLKEGFLKYIPKHKKKNK